LERLLYKADAPFSAKRAAELTKSMYQIKITLPQSKKSKNILLKTDSEQKKLLQILKIKP